MSHVLVVDDEASIGWALREALGDDGHRVDLASSAEDGFLLADRSRFDAVVLDVRLPGIDGLTALRGFHDRLGPVPVIVITAFGSLETAVRAVEVGAYDYLVKPFDLDQAARVIGRALAYTAPQPPAPGVPEATTPEIVGSSAAMQGVYKQIALVAAAEVPVLITGESGTGKELVARAIHRHGPRRDGPFIPVSVPALSPSLIERELFGHLRGAFTGAESDQPGLLARASGGTLLLDEIGDVPLDLQVKLLRAIEYGEIVPVGGSRPVRIDVRFLAATNRPLGQMIAEGGFREDLFFRLSVFPIRVPALRERPEDIPALVHHFARLARGGAPAPTAEAMAALRSRPWPGNVRELRNAIEYASITARGEAIRPEHLPASHHAPADSSSGHPALERLVSEWAASHLADPAEPADLYERLLALIEPPLFLAALDHCRQNRLAAQRLGIHRETLRQKLRRHGLADPPADR